ncbi:MAG: hypothetical protein E7329_02170 [Clostridiales bacterium]|nr:hypothetical protein [Clostridiales bacterium]
MIQGRRVVVPFERPASYWATRARRHYTPARMPEAARLMRKALEKSGDPATALELARIYTGMGCYTAAEKCLSQAIARGGLTGNACFTLAECALGRGEEALAEHALEGSLRLDPQGVFSLQAQYMLESYPWQWEAPLPRSARGEAIAKKAQRALLAGRMDEARDYAWRAWEKSHTWQNAMLLGTLLPPEKAGRYLRFAAEKRPGMPMPRLLLARACFLAGKKEDAAIHLCLAAPLCQNLSQVESFCIIAWEMEKSEEALALANQQLSQFPAGTDYLRLKYISLKRLGMDEDAHRALETLLEIDPYDAAAQWYRRHPEEKEPQMARPMLLQALGYQLNVIPRRLREGPLNRLLHLMVMSLAGEMDAEQIYHLVPPVWRRMSPAQKKSCDERQEPHYAVSFALYLLLAAGRGKKAAELFRAAPGKKRLMRTLKRIAQWTEKE